MRDPQADVARRAWVGCPRCIDERGCATCGAGRTCETHWRFLLAVRGRQLFLQCPGCEHRWWHDTGFGAGERPRQVDAVPDVPPPGTAAA